MSKINLTELFRKNPLLLKFKEDITELLKELEEKFNPKIVIFAGSAARGEFVEGLSDLDLLLVADAVDKPVFMLRSLGNLNVEVTVYPVEAFREALRGGNQFVLEAVRGGLMVKGRVKDIR
ncbi:MAG: nucleotidyltransferase domain-containing protein [Candidatus Hecatellaceae archaeon]